MKLLKKKRLQSNLLINDQSLFSIMYSLYNQININFNN